MFHDDLLTFRLAPPPHHQVWHCVFSDPVDDGGFPHVGEDAGQFITWVNSQLDDVRGGEDGLTPNTGRVTAEVLTADPHEDVIPEISWS